MNAQGNHWRWLSSRLIHAVHDEQLAEHGGGAGVRDENLLGSALARPQQLSHCGDPDVADLAASYGFGIAHNHPFIDGNKRTAFVAVELFLALNGSELIATDADAVLQMLALAAGQFTEADFAHWIRSNLAP
ncbi:MAG: type II toxin-antitoxin system death-on-curing family toxin [Rhodoferax sp.]|nr:type II toxin-antitoxin system death-on-curing family toxin [Rhodoferax sp.]